MVTFLKALRRPDGAPTNGAANPPGDRSPLAREKAALEDLVTRAEAAAEQLRSLASITETAAALEAMHGRFAAVEAKLAGLESLAAKFAEVEAHADRLAKSCTRSETQLGHAAEDMERIQRQLATVADKVDRALVLRDELERFLDADNPVAALRAETDGLRTQLGELSEQVGRMRAQADDALSAHRHATGRLESFDQEHQAATGRLEELVRRVQAAELALEPLQQATEAIPNVQHQLAVLKALAEQVSQKVATLEQQREAVDRAATQITQLTRLDRELDTWLRRQEEQIRRFGAVEAKIAEVQALHAKVLARTDELREAQQHVDEGHRAARQALTDLREQMRKSSEAFELENRGLHAVSERVADLRAAVKECETRFDALDAASQGAAAIQAQVRSLTEQTQALSEDFGRLMEEARRLGTLRQEGERLQALADETAARMERIQSLKPDVDHVIEQLGALKGTQEMMADGLEQMRLAYDAMSRLRESHAETEAWLANTDVWTRKVQAQVKELSGMEATVERMQAELDHIKTAMAEVEARRNLMDEVHQRLVESGAVSAELKERIDALRARMDGAEARFAQLARQAEEAQRVADVIGAVTASVAEAERRTGVVDDSVRALESRTQQLDELEERIRLLGLELEQRQGALDKATAHLARASSLRQEAAAAAQRLEELARTMGGTLADAEKRADTLQQLTTELEARATALKPIDRQLAHFEELLATWESAQADAARALEQTLARQAAVDALETQVKHVFELAERAVADVHAIGAARREVEETKTLLEETQAQLRAADEALQGFEVRRRQLERAEQRLARAEALAVDVRSSVEALQAQRAITDHVIERAGALAFQMKQAEALIEALRRERTLASEVRAAVAAVRDEEDAEEPTDG